MNTTIWLTVGVWCQTRPRSPSLPSPPTPVRSSPLVPGCPGTLWDLGCQGVRSLQGRPSHPAVLGSPWNPAEGQKSCHRAGGDRVGTKATVAGGDTHLGSRPALLALFPWFSFRTLKGKGKRGELRANRGVSEGARLVALGFQTPK